MLIFSFFLFFCSSLPDLQSRQVQQQALERRRKRRSMEGAKEGQALIAFRNSVQILEDDE